MSLLVMGGMVRGSFNQTPSDMFKDCLEETHTFEACPIDLKCHKNYHVTYPS